MAGFITPPEYGRGESTERRRSTQGISSATAARELEPDDADDDESDAREAQHRRRLTEQHDAEDRGADAADRGPHGVRRAEWQRAEREAEEAHAREQRDGGADGRPQPREAVGVLESHGPADLEQ